MKMNCAPGWQSEWAIGESMACINSTCQTVDTCKGIARAGCSCKQMTVRSSIRAWDKTVLWPQRGLRHAQSKSPTAGQFCVAWQCAHLWIEQVVVGSPSTLGAIGVEIENWKGCTLYCPCGTETG